MRLKKTTIFFIVIFIVGLCLFSYPSIADYWNSHFTTRIISDYTKQIEQLDDNAYEEMWKEAQRYNEDLRAAHLNSGALPENLKEQYEKCLSLNEYGTMGYIEIPSIDVTLTVYHGTSIEALETGVGHLEWTALPTGGAGNHCVLSAHRGLPSARLFTDLDKLREGDTFMLVILNETLTYEVDQIRTVEPSDVSYLAAEAGKDFCTLVTCTPYGINTHRLLVRGHRVETNLADYLHVNSEAVVIDPLIVAPVVALPILITLMLMVIFKKPAPKKPVGTQTLNSMDRDKK